MMESSDRTAGGGGGGGGGGSGGEAVMVVAKFDYAAQDAQELDMKKNDKLILLDDSRHWWRVQNTKNQTGYVPSNYVKREKASFFKRIKQNLVTMKDKDKSTSMPTLLSADEGVPQPVRAGVGVGGVASSTTGMSTLPAGGGDRTGNNGSYPPGGSDSASNNSEGNQCNLNINAIVKFKYDAMRDDEISLMKGAIVTIMEKSPDGWWRGECGQGKVGWFPSNYVQELYDMHSNTPQQVPSGMSTTSSSSNANSTSKVGLASSTPSSPTTLPPSGHDSPNRGFGALPPTPTNQQNNKTATPQLIHADGRLYDSHGDSDVLHIVLTLYPFRAQNDEELSFHHGERLEIIEKPANDPEWWRARNSRGGIGLVPRNYVEVLEDEALNNSTVSQADAHLMNNSSNSHLISGQNHNTTNSTGRGSDEASNSDQAAITALYYRQGVSGPLACKDWYYGAIKRHDCDEMLNHYGADGDFVIRDSETNAGDFSVSLKAPGKNKHFRVRFVDGVFNIGQRRFASLDELVDHYKKAPIYTGDSGKVKLFLVKSFIMPPANSG